MAGKINYRIKWAAIGEIFLIAGIWELLTLIPLVGTFIGWIYWAGFTYYLYKTGHGLANWRIIAPEIISTIAEFIPAVQELPTILAATAVVIVISRGEDKTGISLTSVISKKPGVTSPHSRPVPVNSQAGIRPPRT